MVGMPLIVIVPDVALPEKEAVKPGGRLTAVPIPVAPVVEKVILGLRGVFRQTVALGAALVNVIAGVTVILP